MILSCVCLSFSLVKKEAVMAVFRLTLLKEVKKSISCSFEKAQIGAATNIRK